MHSSGGEARCMLTSAIARIKNRFLSIRSMTQHWILDTFIQVTSPFSFQSICYISNDHELVMLSSLSIMEPMLTFLYLIPLCLFQQISTCILYCSGLSLVSWTPFLRMYPQCTSSRISTSPSSFTSLWQCSTMFIRETSILHPVWALFFNYEKLVMASIPSSLYRLIDICMHLPLGQTHLYQRMLRVSSIMIIVLTMLNLFHCYGTNDYHYQYSSLPVFIPLRDMIKNASLDKATFAYMLQSLCLLLYIDAYLTVCLFLASVSQVRPQVHAPSQNGIRWGMQSSPSSFSRPELQTLFTSLSSSFIHHPTSIIHSDIKEHYKFTVGTSDSVTLDSLGKILSAKSIMLFDHFPGCLKNDIV